MRIPDFFIVGAPKCGTTSLYHWLRQHQDVFMSPVKEPSYFAFDHPRRRSVSDLAQYLALFVNAKPGQQCGEASTSYLDSDVAIPAILEANPQAKVIVMLRNPLEMVPSLHAQKLYSRVDEIQDLETAWRVSPKRDRWLDYRRSGLLGMQLARVKAMVPDRQLHVIVQDDLESKPGRVYRDVLLFLGSATVPDISFARANIRKRRRLESVENFIRHPPAPVDRIKRRAIAAAPIRMKTLRDWINRLNSRPLKRASLPASLRQEMLDFYRDDIAKLGSILNRDLSHWSSSP